MLGASEERYGRLLERIHAEFPGFAVLDKRSSLLQRSIGTALRVLTLGAQSSYLDQYVTTIGQRVYVPASWSERSADERWLTMRHELVHLRQFRRWTLPLMGLLYLLFPLPLGLAWARMRFERPAYEETIRAAAELYGKGYVCDAAFRAHVTRQFTSGSYGWMWPFPSRVERWYDGVLATLA